MTRMTKMAWERKKTDAGGSGAHIQGPKHHLHVHSQYKRGGLEVKGLRGCGLVVGGIGLYFGVPLRLLLEKMSC